MGGYEYRGSDWPCPSMIVTTQNQHQMIDNGASFVEELKARSEEAWARLYGDHYQPLYRYVFARSSDAGLSEDLAANVFVEALKGIDRFQHRGKPIAAWLYRIARNLVADHFSGRRRVQPLSSLAPEDTRHNEILVGSGSSAVSDPSLLVQNMDLRQAIQKLKAEHQEVIALHYYAGLTIPQIATVLDKKERAMYSLHERAVESLRRKMRDDLRTTE